MPKLEARAKQKVAKKKVAGKKKRGSDVELLAFLCIGMVMLSAVAAEILYQAWQRRKDRRRERPGFEVRPPRQP